MQRINNSYKKIIRISKEVMKLPCLPLSYTFEYKLKDEIIEEAIDIENSKIDEVIVKHSSKINEKLLNLISILQIKLFDHIRLKVYFKIFLESIAVPSLLFRIRKTFSNMALFSCHL